MKKGFRTEIFRSIKKSLSRFIAIAAIVALGAGFFAGLRVCAPYMRSVGDSFYDETNMMDIRLISTMGFTDADIVAIKNAVGINNVMPTYSLDAVAKKNDDKFNVHIHGLPENRTDDSYINQLVLVDGRLPQNKNECVVNAEKLDTGDGIGIGDKITLSIPDGEIDDMLKAAEYEVVGIVKSSYYISFSLGSTPIGDGTVDRIVYLQNDAFASEVYTEVFATAIDAKAMQGFSKAYQNRIDEVSEVLEGLADERVPIRYDEVLEEARAELDKARQEFLAEKGDAEQKLSKAKQELIDADAAIAENRKLLNDGFAQYNSATNELRSQRKQVEEKLAGLAMLEQSGMPMPEGVKEQLDAAMLQIEAGEIALASNWATLKASERELEKASRELADGEREYAKSEDDAEREFKKADQELHNAEVEIEKIAMPKWYVLDREANIGYMELKSDSTRMDSIATVFPIIFFAVAALVALTTMTRMVEEERVQIGTLKALGYSKGTIMSKYLIYAALASVIGCAIGSVILCQLLPYVVWNAYSLMYIAPAVTVGAYPLMGILASLAAILCTLTATFLACRSTLQEVPATLMLPRAPKAGRRILLERIPFLWKRMSFLIKVTARNLFRYKKRLLMTVIGIAGCTALLVTGFGIRDSISAMVPNQYGEVYKFNCVIGLDEDYSSFKLKNLLEENEDIEDYIFAASRGIDISANEKTVSASLYVPKERERMSEFISLQTRVSNEPISFDENSVILAEKMKKTLGVKVGDTITVKNADDKEIMLSVSAFTENYIGQNIYFSEKVYHEVFNETVEYNSVLAKTTADADLQQTIFDELSEHSDISTVQFIGDITGTFDDMLSSLDSVMVMITFSAGLLAFIVLYNLTNINVTERQRELATIKVLGFYNREVSAYIYRETAMLTVIGCIAGLFLGVLMHNYVVQTVEVDMVMFSRSIEPLSFVWSAILTIAFAVIVNVVMYFKLKKIDMVESLKSID